jgi:predicted DNA-binding antitoxin AbrB/MazE fold protein
MTILTTHATYSGGVFKPVAKIDLPEGTAVELRISTVSANQAIDPKDAILNDAAALQNMYAEFAREDRQLAETGLEYYAHTLEEEEKQS